MEQVSLLNQISICIERGKLSKLSPYPPDMKGIDGTIELTEEALSSGIKAAEILNNGMMPGMKRVGEKFKAGEIFIPEVLLSAKAMNGAMKLLEPFFKSGEVKLKGKVILGTVAGDLHDIGKNIVNMVLEGGGWEVIDLGIDVSAEKFYEAVKEHSVKVIGLSALLTTTMQNMQEIVLRIKEYDKDIDVIIGGAPVSQNFADQINADAYFPDPHGMLDYLNQKFQSV